MVLGAISLMKLVFQVRFGEAGARDDGRGLVHSFGRFVTSSLRLPRHWHRRNSPAFS